MGAKSVVKNVKKTAKKAAKKTTKRTQPRERRVIVLGREKFRLESQRRRLLYEVVYQGITWARLRKLRKNETRLNEVDTGCEFITVYRDDPQRSRRGRVVLDDEYEVHLSNILDTLDGIVFDGVSESRLEDLDRSHAKLRELSKKKMAIVHDPIDLNLYLQSRPKP